MNQKSSLVMVDPPEVVVPSAVAEPPPAPLVDDGGPEKCSRCGDDLLYSMDPERPEEPIPVPCACLEPKGTQAPMGFVHMGTSTEASERLYETRYQDAEERRREADFDREISRDQKKVERPDMSPEEAAQAPAIMMPGHHGGAVQYASQLSAHDEIPKAYILLKYVTRKGEETGFECLADLIIGVENDPNELTLIIVCARCQRDSHKHQQDNQLRIRQSNKKFVFVAGKGPSHVTFEDKSYPSAGMITESESFKCPDCSMRMRIHNNTVRPD